MKELSMLDVAFKVISESKEPVPFLVIWNDVIKQLGFNEKDAERKITTFYTNLSTDGRFYNVGENVWGLRSRFTYEQVNAAIDFTREDASDEDELDDEFEDEEFEDEELEEKDELDEEEDEDDIEVDSTYEEEEEY